LGLSKTSLLKVTENIFQKSVTSWFEGLQTSNYLPVKPKCKNWKPLRVDTNLGGLIGCCFRTKEMEFVGQSIPNKYQYFILREIAGQYIIELSDTCAPFMNSPQQKFDRSIRWEYCCDVKVSSARDEQ
jgi:hypothetical protein